MEIQEVQKVRVINKKGEVKFIMPHIAKDKKIMSSYGYRIEDLSAKTESKVNNGSNNAGESNDPLDLLNTGTEKLKGKRGRKPNAKK